MDNMPLIFQTSTLSYEERFTVYMNLILGNCKPTEVKNKVSDYVERIVQKTGWKAIWSYPGSDAEDSFNVLVEVVDVHSQDLSAEVSVCQPLTADSQMTLQEVQQIVQAKKYHIPLVELLPVHEDSGDFDETALALEHVRFFYENLWREWDDDGDYLYAARNLENRLRLYYDISQKNLSKDFIRKYTDTYNDYKQKIADLNKLRKDMAASDSEQELDSSDVLCLAKKTHELENIVKSLQTMENPQMRYLMASANAVKRPLVDRDYSVTMIVAEQVTAKMTKELPDDAIIELYTSPEKAIGRCVKNDRILIYSGRYHVVDPLNLKESVTIIGVGETIIECDDNMYDETIITSQSPELHINNIKFTQSASNSWLFVIENGKAILNNCEFHCVSNAIMVKRGAELVMQNCKVYGALSAGLTIEENAVVHVEGCEIRRNGSANNDGGIKIISSETTPATVLVVGNKIEENFGHGISVVVDGSQVIHNCGAEQETVKGVCLELKRNRINNNTIRVQSS